eukprot:TRINITY_DN466_c0_g1_i1.p1 TRINITY_DN466_c0_g1~~TRINITY_DN466_c0_g1_i1.p1  ORF type:complete len:274 (-),score=38.20 TRINITY_DN466_c0_g1_i1:197-1018(-)
MIALWHLSLTIVFVIGIAESRFVQVFNDNFNNLNNWVIEDTFDVYTHSCSMYRNNPANVFIASDGLHLKVTSGDGGCPNSKGGCVYSGRLHSASSWLYGVFVVTAKVPKGNQLWPALWITATQGCCWPTTGEIDLMETVHTNPSVTGTLHCGASVSNSTAEPGVPAPPNNIYAYPNWNNYNTFVMNWQPDNVTFWLNAQVDENGIHGTPLEVIRSSQYSSCPKLTTPLSWVFNIAVGGYYQAPCGEGNCWNECQNANTSEMIVSNAQVWEWAQ